MRSASIAVLALAMGCTSLASAASRPTENGFTLPQRDMQALMACTSSDLWLTGANQKLATWQIDGASKNLYRIAACVELLSKNSRVKKVELLRVDTTAPTVEQKFSMSVEFER